MSAKHPSGLKLEKTATDESGLAGGSCSWQQMKVDLVVDGDSGSR